MRKRAKFRVGQVVCTDNSNIQREDVRWGRVATIRWNLHGASAPCWEYGIRFTLEGEIDPGWQDKWIAGIDCVKQIIAADLASLPNTIAPSTKQRPTPSEGKETK